jgi:hypothetical protein
MAALTVLERKERKEASIFLMDDTVRSFSHSVPRLLGRARVCVGARRGGAAGYARAALGGVALEAGGALLSARLAAILSTSSPPLLTELLHTCN